MGTEQWTDARHDFMDRMKINLVSLASLSALENEGGEAPVEAGEVCPACMGKKMIRTGYKIMSDCEKCDGTGQATPEAKEGRGEA
jgi:DnaJ-class molecular chaperone